MCNFLWIEKLTSPGKNIKLDKNGQKEEEEWGDAHRKELRWLEMEEEEDDDVPFLLPSVQLVFFQKL